METVTGGAICNICGYASDIYNDVRQHLEALQGHPLCPAQQRGAEGDGRDEGGDEEK